MRGTNVKEKISFLIKRYIEIGATQLSFNSDSWENRVSVMKTAVILNLVFLFSPLLLFFDIDWQKILTHDWIITFVLILIIMYIFEKNIEVDRIKCSFSLKEHLAVILIWFCCLGAFMFTLSQLGN